MSRRLSLATVGQLPRELAPRVDPGALSVGIVHLGIGAFHRAHQAAYTEDAIAAAGGDWGICGVSQRSPSVIEQLAPQDGLYTLAQRDGAGERLRVIGAVRELHWAQADPDVLRERLAAPGTRVITLTVTEKGYHHDPATNRLRLDSPDVAADLADGGSRTVVGPARRRPGATARHVTAARSPCSAATTSPTTARCCAAWWPTSSLTMPAGRRAGRVDRGHTCRFPSTMVDRITPATTEDDLARIAGALGARDDGAVVTEPFTQWVIEDDFAAGRPAWERAGAILTADVRPYEQIKLRMLNGAHSTLAYLAQLGGLRARLRRRRRRRAVHHSGRRAHGRRRRAHAGGAGRLRPRRLPGRAAAALRQPGAAPPHVADRHGRQPEAADAPARHDP